MKKYQNEINHIKKVSKVIQFTDFFFVRAASTVIWNLNRKIITMFIKSKIQAMRKLNNPTTTLFAGPFLTIVRFNLLK